MVTVVVKRMTDGRVNTTSVLAVVSTVRLGAFAGSMAVSGRRPVAVSMPVVPSMPVTVN